jgi:methionyl-tRNA formyltransferase
MKNGPPAHRVTLYLMGHKGLNVLQSLVDGFGAGFVERVVSETNLEELSDQSTTIRQLCATCGIRCDTRDSARGISHDCALAAGWRWLIPSHTNLIVLHDSLLPRYRGFAPLVSALINGDSEIGVTAFKATAEPDRGPIILQRAVRITHPISIAAAIAAVTPLYGEIAAAIAPRLIRGEFIEATPQDESRATYSLWRDADDYQIDWNQDSERIVRFILAVGLPYAGALTRVGGQWCRVIDADVRQDVSIENRQPGKVIFLENGLPIVVCRTGLVLVKKAVWKDSGSSVLPLKHLKVRFG